MPYTIHHTPYTIHHTPYTIHHTPYTIHHTPYTIHHTPYTIHHTLCHRRASLSAGLRTDQRALGWEHCARSQVAHTRCGRPRKTRTHIRQASQVSV
ncbi:hypothetical protein EON63_06320 [archaeon]|nr:MAG: hypothetical protein EON63_06320 [archaeon]